MEIVCARALGNTQCNTLTPPHHSPPQYSFALTLIVIAEQLISVQMNRNFNATPLFLQTARFCGFRLNTRARALLLQYVFRSLNFFFVPFSVCFQFLSFFSVAQSNKHTFKNTIHFAIYGSHYQVQNIFANFSLAKLNS